jgi:hypothetical protein
MRMQRKNAMAAGSICLLFVHRPVT